MDRHQYSHIKFYHTQDRESISPRSKYILQIFFEQPYQSHQSKMQYAFTTAILFALSCNIAYSIPLAARQDPESVDTAQGNWVADTSLVSNFLSIAETLSGNKLANQAQAALNAENDELTWKAALDSVFVFVDNPDPTVQVANGVLVDQGTFMIVVNGLQDLATNGAGYTTDQVVAKVQAINQDRCNLVLPAIDQYFIAASNFLNNGTPLTAVRATNCP